VRVARRWAAAATAGSKQRGLAAVAAGSACLLAMRAALGSWRRLVRARLLAQRQRARSISSELATPGRERNRSSSTTEQAIGQLECLGQENAALVQHIEQLQGTLRTVWLNSQLNHLNELEADLQEDLDDARSRAAANDLEGASSGHVSLAEEIASLVQQLEAVRWQRRALEDLGEQSEEEEALESAEDDDVEYEAFEPASTELLHTYVPFGQAPAAEGP